GLLADEGRLPAVVAEARHGQQLRPGRPGERQGEEQADGGHHADVQLPMTRPPHRARRSGALAAALLLAGVAAAAPAAPLPRDVHVADVTPTAFSVVWTTDAAATGTVAVFEDVLGTKVASGAVIEPGLVLGGDTAVRTAAEDLGVLRVRVSGLAPDTAYF